MENSKLLCPSREENTSDDFSGKSPDYHRPDSPEKHAGHCPRLHFLATRLLCVANLLLLMLIFAGALLAYRGKNSKCLAGLSVGSDYGGFVPQDISSKPTLWTSGLDEFYVRGEAFGNTSVLEEILTKWKNRYGTFYVPALGYSDGPQVPFKDGTIAIAIFHQMHCLTTLLEDFGRLAAGTRPEQLPSYADGPPGYWGKHKAHCFNQVRQALECLSDSTAEGHNELLDPERHSHSIADTGVTHVCNDFQALLAWKNGHIAGGGGGGY